MHSIGVIFIQGRGILLLTLITILKREKQYLMIIIEDNIGLDRM